MKDGASRRAGKWPLVWELGNLRRQGYRGNKAAGFTIVETLIVIAVSGFMLLSAVLLVTGQQRKVEFVQAAEDIRSVIEQTMSEVGSGYYNNPGDFRCSVVGNNLTFTQGTPVAQGSNTGCITIGKAMQFGVASTSPQQFVTHTVAALQDNTGTLSSAKPQAVDLEAMRSTARLRNGLRAVDMWYTVGGVKQSIGAVAFVSGLGNYGSNGLVSGTQQVSLVPIPGSGAVPSTSITDVVTAIRLQMPAAPVNPDGGVGICFSSGEGRSALLTLGGNARSLSVKLDIKNTADCT